MKKLITLIIVLTAVFALALPVQADTAENTIHHATLQSVEMNQNNQLVFNLVDECGQVFQFDYHIETVSNLITYFESDFFFQFNDDYTDTNLYVVYHKGELIEQYVSDNF